MVTRNPSPLASMFTLHEALNQLFEHDVTGPVSGIGGTGLAQLPLNVYELDDALHVEALAPGIGEEDIQVDIDRGVLTIAAKRQGPAQGNRRWHLSEFGAGAFTRALRLPYPVDPDHITAQFTNGVLSLTLPKAESAKPRRIAIGGEQQAQIGSGHAKR
jgi:HSP20 family protein